MGRYVINGLTFEDDKDSLQHGLGVGGGRGRPKGSRNGYINPNAAYMKGYEIKGEVADPLNTGMQPQNPQRQRTWAPAPQTAGPTRRMTTKEVNTRMAAANNTAKAASSSKPATSVQNGKSFLEKALGATTQAVVDAGDSVRDNVIKPVEQWWNGTDKQNPASKGVPAGLTNAYQQGTPDVPGTTEHTKGAREAVEETLVDAGDTAKEWWESFLDWGEQAWKDVSKAATSAIDTGKGWAKSGFDWVNNNVINPVGKWGETAISDVGNWIGERGRDLDRWWNGYEAQKSDLYGSQENRERRQSGVQEGDHVNGFRENAANWLDQAGQDIGKAATDVGNWIGDRGRDITAIPGQVGNWFDERGQDFNRWWNGTGEDRYVQVGTNENGPIYERQTDNGVRGQIADLPRNTANFVQRQMIDPVTNTVKTYLIDPVTNTAVAVGDFATNFANDVQNNFINPVRGAAEWTNDNIIQPTVKWTNENVVQPTVKWTNENVVQPLADAADRGYRYVQNYGDDISNRARETGVPANVVDGINREAANNGSSYQENLDTRSDMMSMLSVLRRNGSLSENEIQRMYANAQNSSNPLSSMYNDVLNAYYNQPQPRNYVRR